MKETELWRSEKTRIGRVRLNLWYATAGTNCGLLQLHKFEEFHTQIYGIGRLQKYRTKSIKSLYQEVYMSPGFTHDPLYTGYGKYVPYQYYADSDCIWLAIEQDAD